MTHHVSEREQGELQGAIGSLRSIAFVIGPFLFSWTFAWFIDPRHSFHVPAAGYYLAAALLFSAMLMATGIKQPDFSAAKAPVTDRIPDVVPPEGVTSGNVAPLSDGLSRENIGSYASSLSRTAGILPVDALRPPNEPKARE